MKSRLFTAWVLATAVAVTLAYQAVGLVQTQVTEQLPLLAAVAVTSTTIRVEDLPPVPPTVTVPGDLEDRVDAPPPSPSADSMPEDGTDDGTTTTTIVEATTVVTSAPSTSTSTTTTTIAASTYLISSGGGTVKVSCADDEVGFLAAYASSGFQQKVRSEGPQEVRVTFEDRDDHKFEIKATCKDGDVHPTVNEDHDD